MGKTLGLDRSGRRREVIRLLRWSGTEGILYIIILSIERLFGPLMFTYQIIIMHETSTLLTVDKNEQTLVERLNKLFTVYYHADCTANHKYVPERCLFYIYRYHSPQ